ncbi:30S ribosomal protein S15, partial [Candidatus Bathyarchaeota archaeon]
QYGIPLVTPITGQPIPQILSAHGLARPIPDDLENLLRKAARLTAHLEKHRKDYHNKRALQMVEAKIHRLARYYKRKGILPPDWRYEPKAATVG